MEIRLEKMELVIKEVIENIDKEVNLVLKNILILVRRFKLIVFVVMLVVVELLVDIVILFGYKEVDYYVKVL